MQAIKYQQQYNLDYEQLDAAVGDDQYLGKMYQKTIVILPVVADYLWFWQTKALETFYKAVHQRASDLTEVQLKSKRS